MSLLVYALNKLLSDSINKSLLSEIEASLELFYSLVPKLYGEHVCSANMHSLIHLVRLWGPLWTTSAFPFENANGVLKRQIHGTRNVLLQMIFMMKSREHFSLTSSVVTSTDTVVDKPIKENVSDTHRTIVGNQSLMMFCRAKLNGVTYYSRRQEKDTLSRKSSFKHNTHFYFGEIQYFFLDNPFHKALMKVLPILSDGVLTDVDTLPVDRRLNPHLLDDTIYKVIKESSEFLVVSLPSIITKCVLISIESNRFEYVVKLPNVFECH